jgi:hypothetical protein
MVDREILYLRRKIKAGESRADEPGAEVKAFLCLSAVRTALTGNPGLWSVIQSRERLYEVIQLLMICGVYAQPESISANIAFGIVKTAVYGSAEVRRMESGSLLERVMARYALDFEFRAEPTPQMRDALPLFWDYMYPPIRRVGGPDDPEGLELLQDRMTPLELYAQYVLEDPPISDVLNAHFREALLRSDAGSRCHGCLGSTTERGRLDQDAHFGFVLSMYLSHHGRCGRGIHMYRGVPPG